MFLILLKLISNKKIIILNLSKKVYESKFNEYRDIDETEMNNYINIYLGEFPIHKLLLELSLNDLLRDLECCFFISNSNE